jgi:asparagine synthase (glutamine-hydrolysing)
VRRLDGTPVRSEQVLQMTGTLLHRGPDGQGVWIGGATGLGHRRLAIIDVADSKQPMSSRDGRVHVCFNGELFNYRELRRDLGGAWRTDGDTEVLPELFLAHGPQGVERLRGQFAYAVVDTRDDSLWLFRDRMGVLPLYYLRTPELFAFASEIKALLPLIGGAPSVDEDSLDAYLARRAVPAPRTLYRGISKLLPGSWLHLSADGRAQTHRWWTPPDAAADDAVSPAEAVDLIRSRLDAAVGRALVADVPVGAYLSGGLDSSLIVATAARARGASDLHTYAAGFDDPRTDELHHARAVAAHVGTRHHEVVVRPEDFLSDWERLTWHRDAPLSEPADIAVHRLAVAASEHVKVVLSGEGSDELFAGYPKHRWAGVGARLALVPRTPRSSVSDALDRLLPRRLHRARVALRALAASPTEMDTAWFAPFTQAERRELLGATGAAPADAARADAAADPLARMIRTDLAAWLPDNLLERGDRMTMAASVELRPPFLDADLVDAALRLPSSVLLHEGTAKWVVKQIARDRLPQHIIERRKAGFRVPLDSWFRSGLAEAAHDRLLDSGSYVGAVMDRRALHRLLRAHASGRNEDIRLWTLLSLEIWHRTCIRGDVADRTTAA